MLLDTVSPDLVSISQLLKRKGKSGLPLFLLSTRVRGIKPIVSSSFLMVSSFCVSASIVVIKSVSMRCVH